jgi:hypothetical protein
MAGLPVTPGDLVSQPLLPNGQVEFSWSARPERVGTYPGVVWLYLRLIPLTSAVETTRPVLAREFQIRSVALLGLGGPPARWLGLLGTILGILAGLDDLYLRAGKSLSRLVCPSSRRAFK